MKNGQVFNASIHTGSDLREVRKAVRFEVAKVKTTECVEVPVCENADAHLTLETSAMLAAEALYVLRTSAKHSSRQYSQRACY